MHQPITLEITDEEILSSLSRHDDEQERDKLIVVALKLGLQALSAARGEIDLQTLQQESRKILAEVKEVIESTLNERTEIIDYQFDQYFSYDRPDSAISRLRDESNHHHSELKTTINEFFVRKQMERLSTQGGMSYEESVGDVFRGLVDGSGDILATVGTQEGSVPRSKVGDFVITLNSAAAAAGEKIVVEAKRDQSYTQQGIWKECADACKNREAQVAIFVWDRAYGEARQQPPLLRNDNFIVALWDAEDPTTDIYLKAAFWLAKGLVKPKIADPQQTQAQQKQQQLVVTAFDNLQKLGAMLEDIRKTADDINKKSQKMLTSITSVHSLLEANLQDLRNNLLSIESESSAP